MRHPNDEMTHSHQKLFIMNYQGHEEVLKCKDRKLQIGIKIHWGM